MELNKGQLPGESAIAETATPTSALHQSSSKATNTTVWQRFVGFWASITVEPVVVCFIVGLYLMSLTDQNMYLEKSCLVNRNYSAEVCDKVIRRDVEDIETEDRETEATYNAVQFWTRPLASWLSVCLVLFWGAWSDRSGLRKPCICFPLIAQLIISLTNMLTSTVFVRTPVELPMYSNAIVDGLSGGPGTLLIGVYSYLADVTPPDELSYRVGMTSWSLLVGNIFGNAVSGIVIRLLGYRAVYSLSASLFAIALVYTWFWIEESDKKSPPAVAVAAQRLQQTPESADGIVVAAVQATEGTSGKIKSSLIRQFFDLDHVVQTCRVVTRIDPRNRNRRPVVILLLVIWVLVAGPLQGEGALLYLFTRLHFNWTEVELSVFATFNSVTSLIGNTFIVNVLSGCLKANDAVIAIVGLSSKLLANIVYASAKVSWFFFTGSIVEMLSSGINIAMRSIATKAVGTDEVGKMNALLALVESAVPLIFTPLYVTVYESTRDYWPSAFLAMGVLLLMPPLPVFIWIGLFVKNSYVVDENNAATDLELAAAHDNKSFEPDAAAATTMQRTNDNEQRSLGAKITSL